MKKQLDKKKICIVGHFGKKKTLANGQTIKTKIFTEELKNQLGIDQVITVDTCGGARNIVPLCINIIKKMKRVENIVIFPAQNGIRVLAPLLLVGKKIWHTKIHYMVIGGWLPHFLFHKKILKNILKQFDGIYVETVSMKEKLMKWDFSNIFIVPNCKNLDIISENELFSYSKNPFKVCTFSRVMREKGIEDAIDVVKEINTKYKKTIVKLDIYGEIDDRYCDYFAKLQMEFPNYISYKGIIPYGKSVEVLKQYFVVLFPTHFYTEGIPGTVIDALAAGVPVVASHWENFQDIIEENITGWGYPYGQKDEFRNQLEKILIEPQYVDLLRENCRRKAMTFTATNVIKQFTKYMMVNEK